MVPRRRHLLDDLEGALPRYGARCPCIGLVRGSRPVKAIEGIDDIDDIDPADFFSRCRRPCSPRRRTATVAVLRAGGSLLCPSCAGRRRRCHERGLLLAAGLLAPAGGP